MNGDQDSMYPIPPELKSQVLGVNIGAGACLAGGLVSLAGAAVTGSYALKGQPAAWIPVLMLMPFSLMFFYLFAYIRRVFMGRVRRAARVMATTQARAVLMTGLGIADFSGMYVALRTPDSAPGKYWGVAAFQTGKRKQPPKEETPVQVYQDPQGADGFMLLRYENRIVTGRMTTAESRAVSWRRMRLLFIGLGVITALVVAGLVIIQAGRVQHLKEDRIQAEASRSWPQVQGMVTASEIANTRISKGKSSVAGYRADIEYTYAVGGTEFVGWALYFGYRESTERDRALALVDRFPRGREIPVWYNPARPETAVLEPGHEEDAQEHLTKAWTALMTSGLIGGLMVVILLVAVFVSRSRWNRAMASVNAAGLP